MSVVVDPGALAGRVAVAARGDEVVAGAPAEQRALGKGREAGLPVAEPPAQRVADAFRAGDAFEQDAVEGWRRPRGPGPERQHEGDHGGARAERPEAREPEAARPCRASEPGVERGRGERARAEPGECAHRAGERQREHGGTQPPTSLRVRPRRYQRAVRPKPTRRSGGPSSFADSRLAASRPSSKPPPPAGLRRLPRRTSRAQSESPNPTWGVPETGETENLVSSGGVCASTGGTASAPRTSSANAPARVRGNPDRSPANAGKEGRDAPRNGTGEQDKGWLTLRTRRHALRRANPDQLIRIAQPP